MTAKILVGPVLCTLKQCTSLLLEKADVAPDRTVGISKQECLPENQPGFKNHGKSYIVQNRVNYWPHKMDLGPTQNIWEKRFFFLDFRRK